MPVIILALTVLAFNSKTCHDYRLRQSCLQDATNIQYEHSTLYTTVLLVCLIEGPEALEYVQLDQGR